MLCYSPESMLPWTSEEKDALGSSSADDALRRNPTIAGQDRGPTKWAQGKAQCVSPVA